jgi:hypothetical protein
LWNISTALLASSAEPYAGELVEHQVAGRHHPSLGEVILQVIFQRAIREVTDEQSACVAHTIRVHHFKENLRGTASADSPSRLIMLNFTDICLFDTLGPLGLASIAKPPGSSTEECKKCPAR